MGRARQLLSITVPVDVMIKEQAANSISRRPAQGSKIAKGLQSVITVHRQTILLLVVESGTRKSRKVVESRTKFR